MLKIAAGIVGAGFVAGAAVQRDDGLRRAAQFYTSLAPIAIHYRLQQGVFKLRTHVAEQSSLPTYFANMLRLSPEEEEARWNSLHVKYCDEVLAHFLQLRAFYVKLGQFLAGRGDLVPELYLTRFRSLEDNCPAEDGPTIKAIVARDLGVDDLQEIFASFDDTPIGSASIGQVHKAVLRDGRPVCVKVQHPGVEFLFRSDIKTCRFFCRFVAPEQLAVFDEIERQFLSEFDYRLEAAQLQQARANMAPLFGEVYVPAPNLDLCTPHVLVMEFVPGVKLRDGVRAAGRRWAARQGTTLEALEAEMRAKFNREGLPPPYSGPSAAQIEYYRWGLRVVSAIINAPAAALNMLGGVLGLPRLPTVNFDIPLNSAAVMATLLAVTAKQIFDDGFVQADPHAGNFLLMPDGRIGLIDFGQVKRLTLAERLYLAKTVVATQRNDKVRLRELAIANGYKSKFFDPEVIHKMTIFALDQDGREVTEGKNIKEFMDDMYARDPWTDLENSIIMPSRVSLMVRGIGLMLNHPVSVCSVWGPAAEKLLRDNNQTYLDD